MPAGKGLSAPQNDFLDAIARKFHGTHDNFVLGNARAPGYPIVYCSDGFCKLTGCPRAKVMTQSSFCPFLVGPETNQEDANKISQALSTKHELKSHILLYRSDGATFRCLLDIIPIKNETGEVVLLFLSYKDISDDRAMSLQATEMKPTDFRTWKMQLPLVKSRKLSEQYLENRVIGASIASKKATATEEKIRLPEYKVQTGQKSRWIIPHYCLFRTIWDWIVLLCTLYTVTVVPFNATFFTLGNTDQKHGADDTASTQKRTIYADVFVELLFTVDLILNFRTTYVGNGGQVIYDGKRIAIHYVKTWFFVDLLAVIPFEILFISRVTQSTTILLLKTARLLRLRHVVHKISRFAHHSAAVLSLLMVAYALVCHWLACLWFVVGYFDWTNDPNGLKNGWLYLLTVNTENVSTHNTSDGGVPEMMPPSVFSSYVTSMYFTTTILTSVGFGNVAANTDNEKIFSILAMMIGALMHAIVFGNVVAIIQRIYARKMQYYTKWQDLTDFFKTHQIPKPLRTKMNDFFQKMWSTNKGIEPNEVLQDFPEELRSDVSLHLYKDFLTLNLFKDISPGCMKMLAANVKASFTHPGEIVLSRGDAVQHVYLLCNGSMEILRDDLVVAILGKGDLFACDLTINELYDYSVVKSGVTARSLTYCVLQCLSVRGLSDVVLHYRETVEKLLDVLKDELTFNLRDQCNESSPVSTPSSAPLSGRLDGVPNEQAAAADRRSRSSSTACETIFSVLSQIQPPSSPRGTSSLLTLEQLAAHESAFTRPRKNSQSRTSNAIQRATQGETEINGFLDQLRRELSDMKTVIETVHNKLELLCNNQANSNHSAYYPTECSAHLITDAIGA